MLPGVSKDYLKKINSQNYETIV